MTVDVGKMSLDGAIALFDPKLSRRALFQALNSTARIAQSAQSKAVATVYNVKRSAFKKTLILKRAKLNNLEAVSVSVARPTNIVEYKAKQGAKGINVSIKRGDRKVVPGGFIRAFGAGKKVAGARRVPGSSVHESKIRRSKQHGRTIRRGSRKGILIKREALKQVYGPTLSHLADNPEIVDAAFKAFDEEYPGQFEEKLEKIFDRAILNEQKLRAKG